MPTSKDAIVSSLLASFKSGKMGATPYKHWFVEKCLPAEAATEINALPFEAPALGGVSGRREVHNATRTYFDAGNMGKFPVCRAFNEAFQDPRVTSGIETTFGTSLKGTFLRHRVRPGHQRVLARAAHRPRRESVHDAAVSLDRSRAPRSRHRYLRHQQEARRAFAVHAQWRDDFRALEHHLSRL